MIGGYAMIDCTGLDLIKGNTPQTINGLYQKVKDTMASGKAIFACNCNWDGAFVSPIQTFGIEFDGYIIATASTLQIKVTSSDVVTIINMVE